MIQTNTRHYVKMIAERYPGISEDAINRICLQVARQIFSNSVKGRDILIQDMQHGNKMKIFKRDFDTVRANRRAGRQKYRLTQERLARKNEKKGNE